MRTSNLNNYVNLLNDVYAYGSMTTALCRKHKLTNQTTRTLKELKYVDKKGQSLMAKRPSIYDAQIVISKNKEIAKNYNANRLQTEIKFVKPINKFVAQPIKVAKPTIQVIKKNTTEINLFWGMIKIKR